MRHTLKMILAATTALYALPAFALEDDDDVVVTATRLATPTQRLPADVDVIDVEDALDHGATNVAEALSDVAGLDVVRSGGFGQQTSLFSGGANSNHTLVLLDGVRLNDPSSPGAAFDAGQDLLGDLSRIEIVQGPMSAIFGSDAIGGVINMLPRRGGDGAFNARLDIAGGSFATTNARVGIDGTVGALRYAVTGEAYATEGYDLVPERMSTHVGNADGAESVTYAGVFDIALSRRLALDVLLRRRESRADFDAFVFPPPTFAEQRRDDADLEIARNDLTLAKLGAHWRINDSLSLRANGGEFRQQREEADGGVTTSSYYGQRRFTDLTLDWRTPGYGVVAGVETQTEEADIDQGFAAVDARQEHRGAFVTAQNTRGRWMLTGAVRVDDFDGFGVQTTWRAGATLHLNDGARIYGAYGTSFRAPTLYERFVFFGDPNLDPELGRGWEIGADISISAFGRADGAEFGVLYRRQDIDDLIDFNASFSYANIDKAEIESAEARAVLRPLSWLTVQAAYTYADAQDATARTPLLRRPQDAWRVALEMEHGRFSGFLGWRWAGERADQLYGDDGVSAGIGTSPAYGVWRASASWRVSQSVQVFIAADNLTDERYEPVNAFAGAPHSVSFGVRLRP